MNKSVAIRRLFVLYFVNKLFANLMITPIRNYIFGQAEELTCLSGGPAHLFYLPYSFQ